jgi:hypothetical protein
MKAINTEVTTKVTVTETCVTKLIANVEMTYVPDHCMGYRTIKVGEIVAERKGAYWYAPWDFEGNPAENFRIEKLLVTRKITTEVTTDVIE